MEDFSYFEHNKGGKVVVVCFAGNGSKIEEPPMMEFQKTLHNMDDDIHQIFVRDNNKRWYLFGIARWPSIFQMSEHLKSLINGRSSLFIGSCAGGYGALMFGHLVNANMVIAFHPPAYINQQYNAFSPATPLVYELAKDMNKVAQTCHMSKEYMDLNMFTDLFNRKGGWDHAIIFHNPTDTSMTIPLDHQCKFERLPNTSLVIVSSNGKGHEYNVAAEMKRDGVLQPLIETAIKDIQ
jgi:hypothetical protein